MPSDAGPVLMPLMLGLHWRPLMLGLYQISGGYVFGQRTPPARFLDLVVLHHHLNCCMLGNILGLFPGMGSDTVHGPSRSAICCWVSYGLFMVVLGCAPCLGVCWFWLLLQGKWGDDLFARCCIAAWLAAALVIQSWGGVSYCGPSCMIAQVVTALTMHSLGHFPGPQKGERSPWPAPSLCGG